MHREVNIDRLTSDFLSARQIIERNEELPWSFVWIVDVLSVFHTHILLQRFSEIRLKPVVFHLDSYE